VGLHHLSRRVDALRPVGGWFCRICHPIRLRPIIQHHKRCNVWIDDNPECLYAGNRPTTPAGIRAAPRAHAAHHGEEDKGHRLAYTPLPRWSTTTAGSRGDPSRTWLNRPVERLPLDPAAARPAFLPRPN